MDKKQTDWKTCMSKIHIICQILPNSITYCLQEKKEHMKHLQKKFGNMSKHSAGCEIIIIINKCIY